MNINDMGNSKNSEKLKIIVICGPTGVGKTEVGLALAKEFKGEIVSVDSQQIYRGMDIGTAKANITHQSSVPHHLIDVVNPDGHFDASIFTRLADEAIEKIVKSGHLPFVVGGTGLYIRALCKGVCDTPPRSEEVRDGLKRLCDEHGAPYLHMRLKGIDPAAAEKIHPNDFVRISRALEVYELTGKKISELQGHHGFRENRYDVLEVGLNMDRALLYERINKRVERMAANGFLEEVKSLVDRYGPDIRSLKVVGYKELVDCILGRISFEEALNLTKQNTRNLAKRQLTWFRGDKEVVWFDPGDMKGIKEAVRKFLIL